MNPRIVLQFGEILLSELSGRGKDKGGDFQFNACDASDQMGSMGVGQETMNVLVVRGRGDGEHRGRGWVGRDGIVFVEGGIAL